MNLENEVVERCRTRVGRSLGQSWRLDALIGIGGLGAVYAGSHRNGLVAAVKVLHPSLAATPDARAGFPRDVVAANRARHPATVAVLGDETDQQTGPFLILELLIGETVERRALAAGGALPLSQALSITEQLLSALESAHKGGIVHRDVRPRKLFLTSKGELKLLDLGLGPLRELLEPRASVPRHRAAFMAPEQALGRWAEVEARTDVWAVGATLFSMLTGAPVHEGETTAELLSSAATRASRSVGRLRPDLPPALIRLVDCALERERARRFASAAAMRAEIGRVRELIGSPASSRYEGVAPPPSTRRSSYDGGPPSQRGGALEPMTARVPDVDPPSSRAVTSTLRPPAERITQLPAMASPRVPSFEITPRSRSFEPPPTGLRDEPRVAREVAQTIAPPPSSAREVPTLVPPAPSSEKAPSSRRGWVPEPPSTRGWIPERATLRAPRASELPPSSRRVSLPPASARRVLDGVESTRAGQESLFATKELFAHLQGILTGSAQHGARHPEVVRYIERTFQSVAAALQRFPRGLVFRVTPFSFDAGPRTFWEPHPPFDDLPNRLFSTGIRALGLLPGLEEIELSSLLRILTLEPRRTAGSEDDLAALLWEADLPHVAIHRVDVALEGSAQAQLRLAEDRRALLDSQGQSAASILRGPRRVQLPAARLRTILRALAIEPGSTDGSETLALDEPARLAAVAELERGAPGLTDRFALAAAAAYRHVVWSGGPEGVSPQLQASISAISVATPLPALQLASRLCAAAGDPPSPENERLRAALAASILTPEALRQMLAAAPGAPDRADVRGRIAGLLTALGGAHFFAAFEALITTGDGDLRDILLPYVARVAGGHEAAIGANLPRVGEQLGVELTRMLGALGTFAAREALGHATRSPYAAVRIEALCNAEGLDGDRLGVALDGLLADPEPAIRLAALEAIERHRIASAEALLVARITRADFDALPLDERRQTLASLAAVALPRAEKAFIDLLGDTRLIAAPSHEQSRELCAAFLGELASSKEALFALTAASKKRWGNSEQVRLAAIEAIERIGERAARSPEPSKT